MTGPSQLPAEMLSTGEYVRQRYSIADRITADGSSGFRAEARLARQRYLVGTQLTEADVPLFTTLVRFDAVHVGHFKCNLRRLVDYPNLWGYARDLYQRDGFGDTVDFDHIKRHYHMTHARLNPSRMPLGPIVDWRAPHRRDALA